MGRAKQRRGLPRKKSLRYIGSRDHATIELSEEEDGPAEYEEREQHVETEKTERVAEKTTKTTKTEIIVKEESEEEDA